MLDGIDGEAPFADADSVVAPLLQRLLGQDCHRLFNGLLMTRPGSAEQLWHVDGEHLFSTPSGEAEAVSGAAAALPAHCVNVFVPLVDITRANGATEFCASDRLVFLLFHVVGARSTGYIRTTATSFRRFSPSAGNIAGNIDRCLLT